MLKETKIPYEIIVVDDGSQDGTAEAAEGSGDKLIVVRLPRNKGKGAAVREGVLAARMGWVLVVDADLAIPITELPALVRFAGEAELVVGSKRMAGSDVRRSLWRRFCSEAAQLVVRTLVVKGFQDTQCGFKLMRTATAKRLFRVQRLDGFGFDFEVLYLARRYGLSVQEVAVTGSDEGKMRLSAYGRTLLEVARMIGYRLRGSYPAVLPQEM